MESIVVGGLVVLAIGAWIGSRVYVHRSLDEHEDDVDWSWRQAARSLGLRRKSVKGQHRLLGALEGFALCVENVSEADGGPYGRIRLSGAGRICGSISLRRESAFAGIAGSRREDVALADADFDDLVHVEGPEDELLAALDSNARQYVCQLVAPGGAVESGDLHFRTSRFEDAREIERAARFVVEAAQSLEVTTSIQEALAKNATRDPNPRVRKRSLEVLADRHAGSPEASQALRAALGDPQPELRLLAAQRLHGEDAAREALVQLAEESVLPDEVRTRALELLVEGYPYPEAARSVARALPPQPIEPCPALQRAAVRAVGTSRDESALEALCALAEGCADAALGEELAGALARLGGSRVEGALLSLLACEPAQIKRAAAEALGKVGTIRAVEPLLPLAKGVLSGAAGAAAREAIRSIQERLGDAAGGRLSLVDDQLAGALSVGAERQGTKDGGSS